MIMFLEPRLIFAYGTSLVFLHKLNLRVIRMLSTKFGKNCSPFVAKSSPNIKFETKVSLIKKGSNTEYKMTSH